MFYTVNQNNSGGYFIKNKDVSHYVIVEANNVKQAKNKFYEITEEYSEFCPCCGERWGIDCLDEDDATEKPSIYGRDISTLKKRIYEERCIIYYLDGRKEIVEFED